MSFRILLIALAIGMFFGGNRLEAQSDHENHFFIAPELRQSGSYLGVRLADIDANRANALKLGEARGVEVTRVEEVSPAENAGLRTGDVLLSYNGENVLGAQQFVRLVQETPPGRRIKIQFWRDGKAQAATVLTGAPRPFEVSSPAGLLGLAERDFRDFATVDIPNPILVWKSSAMGIECEPVDSQLAQYFGVKQGVLVRSVEKDSAAEKAGLKAGDVVTGIGDRTVTTPHDLSSFMRAQNRWGKTVSVAVVRNHRDLTVTIAPPDNPE